MVVLQYFWKRCVVLFLCQSDPKSNTRMKTAFATTALCLAVFIMALVPTADASLLNATSVRGNGPSEHAPEECEFDKKTNKKRLLKKKKKNPNRSRLIVVE
jgi:hypothetical protein